MTGVDPGFWESWGLAKPLNPSGFAKAYNFSIIRLFFSEKNIVIFRMLKILQSLLTPPPPPPPHTHTSPFTHYYFLQISFFNNFATQNDCWLQNLYFYIFISFFSTFIALYFKVFRVFPQLCIIKESMGLSPLVLESPSANLRVSYTTQWQFNLCL